MKIKKAYKIRIYPNLNQKQLIEKEYPEIKTKLYKEMFWSQSFCLLSTGRAPLDIIKKYIETQGEK